MKLLFILIALLFTFKLYAPWGIQSCPNLSEQLNTWQFEAYIERLGIEETGKEEYYPMKINGKFYKTPYHVINYLNMKGRWQISTIALQDIGYKGSIKTFLHSPQIQKECIIKLIKKNKFYIEFYKLDKYVGKRIHGIELTIPGMISVCLLGGIDKLRRLLKEGYIAKSGTTTVLDYLKLFNQYKFKI